MAQKLWRFGGFAHICKQYMLLTFKKNANLKTLSDITLNYTLLSKCKTVTIFYSDNCSTTEIVYKCTPKFNYLRKVNIIHY